MSKALADTHEPRMVPTATRALAGLLVRSFPHSLFKAYLSTFKSACPLPQSLQSAATERFHAAASCFAPRCAQVERETRPLAHRNGVVGAPPGGAPPPFPTSSPFLILDRGLNSHAFTWFLPQASSRM